MPVVDVVISRDLVDPVAAGAVAFQVVPLQNPAWTAKEAVAGEGLQIKALILQAATAAQAS